MARGGTLALAQQLRPGIRSAHAQKRQLRAVGFRLVDRGTEEGEARERGGARAAPGREVPRDQARVLPAGDDLGSPVRAEADACSTVGWRGGLKNPPLPVSTSLAGSLSAQLCVISVQATRAQRRRRACGSQSQG